MSPRQDFYRYAVGNWLDRTGIPASEPDIGAFNQLEINLDQQLLKLIRDAAAANAAPGSPRQQIGDYWRAAMDLKRLDELGIKPLQDDLDRIAALTLPGNNAALGDLSGRLQIGYGCAPLVTVRVDPDAKNSSAYLLTISAGQQWLDLDDYAKPDRQRVRDLYLAYISSMMRSTGLSAQDAEAAARTVLSIETEISAAQLTPLQSIDPDVTYNIMTLAEAQALIPALDLAAQLQAVGITPPATVQVPNIAALKAVNKVIGTRSVDEIRTLLRWHVLTGRASFLGQPWRGFDEDFKRQRMDLQADKPREREVSFEVAVLLVQQYNAYALLPGVKQDGEPSLTENTADLGGITLAHAALHRALAGKPQPKIDGLTTDQRCFVAWAQIWAYKGRPERVRSLATTDYHANSVLRGYAPLLHLDAFHEAFGTKPGDPMWRAPKDRVVIW